MTTIVVLVLVVAVIAYAVHTVPPLPEPADDLVRCVHCGEEIAYQASRVRWVHAEEADVRCPPPMRRVATPPAGVEIPA